MTGLSSLGRVYEYLLAQFASAEGEKGGTGVLLKGSKCFLTPADHGPGVAA